MKIDGIFAIVKTNLVSVKFKGEFNNEFRLLFDNWQDLEYLEQFFEEHKSDLQSGFYGTMTVEDAVFRTIEESEKMETFIKKVAESGNIISRNTLYDLIFKPLHENDDSIYHLKSKAYGKTKHSWLRLYAIQLAPNHYVVSGGAIKLTETMNERNHLKHELDKLNATAEYLKEVGLITDEDYQFVELSNYD
jgi:hypothetical protein